MVGCLTEPGAGRKKKGNCFGEESPQGKNPEQKNDGPGNDGPGRGRRGVDSKGEAGGRKAQAVVVM